MSFNLPHFGVVVRNQSTIHLVHRGAQSEEQLDQLWHNTQPRALNLTAATATAAEIMWKGNKEKLVKEAGTFLPVKNNKIHYVHSGYELSPGLDSCIPSNSTEMTDEI